MNIENDGLFGPATDLVISLFSMSLILVGIVSGLYLESENEQKFSLEQIEQASKSNEQLVLKLKKESQAYDKAQLAIQDLELRHKTLASELELAHNQLQLIAAKDNEGVIEVLNKRLAELNEKLAKANTDYDRQRRELNSLKYKIAITCKDGDLNKCGGSTKKPKRSRKDKFVVTLIQNSNNNNDLKYKYGERNYSFVSRTEAHRLLKRLKIRYGKKLYVATDAASDVASGKLRQLICDFRQYDYYQFYDPGDCR